MKNKIYGMNSDYILDVLEEEEEKLINKLGGALSEETKYLFYRYVSVRDVIEKIKLKTA